MVAHAQSGTPGGRSDSNLRLAGVQCIRIVYSAVYNGVLSLLCAVKCTLQYTALHCRVLPLGHYLGRHHSRPKVWYPGPATVLFYCTVVLYRCTVQSYCTVVLYSCTVQLYCIVVLYSRTVQLYCIVVLYSRTVQLCCTVNRSSIQYSCKLQLCTGINYNTLNTRCKGCYVLWWSLMWCSIK